jgi:hypothetical protein
MKYALATLAFLFFVPAYADDVSDATARAERVLQDQLDTLNAARYAAGLPLVTLDQIKTQRQRAIEAQQQMRNAIENDGNGGCAPEWKPAIEGGSFYRGGCVKR